MKTNLNQLMFFGGAFLLIAIVMSGCQTGYQKVDGSWKWVTWNEGQGTKYLDIDADVDSFEKINRDYAKDANSVFLRGYLIPGAKPSTFRLLDPPYSTDGHKIFCGSIPMDVYDVHRFRVTLPQGGWIKTGDDGIEYLLGKQQAAKFDFEKTPLYYYKEGHATDGKYRYVGPVRTKN